MALPEQYREIIGAMHRLDLLRRISIRDSARGIELHRTQMPMLEYISAHPGCTQADVSNHLHVSPASIACSAKRMESAGLIARVPDEANLRRNKLTATEAGRARLMQMRAVFDALDARTFRGFSGAELASLSSMLNRMIQNSARGDAAQKTMHELICQLNEMEGEDPC
jgi:hypothetical protein